MYVCHIKRQVAARIRHKNLFQVIFLMNDQPTTCPYCGSTTNVIFDLSHSIAKTEIHECPDEKCKAIFVMDDDEAFNIEMGNIFYIA